MGNTPTSSASGSETPAWASRGGANFAGGNFAPVQQTPTVIRPAAFTPLVNTGPEDPLPSWDRSPELPPMEQAQVGGGPIPGEPYVVGSKMEKTEHMVKTPEMEKPAKASEARLTFYGPGEDIYGSTTAKPGRSGKNQAESMFTAAVDPGIIPYGSYFQIPELKGKIPNNPNAVFLAHDTGSAVKAQTASHGTKPVIDLFANQAANTLPGLNAKMGENITYRMLPKLEATKLFGG